MATPADYRPTLADLGGLLHSRTVDSAGNQLGTFTTDTRPTAVEADAFISRALDLVAPRLGDVPPRLVGMAKAIVALRAGMLVERPKEGDADDGSYSTLRDEYRDAIADYDSALGDMTPTKRARVASVSTSYLNPRGR